MSSTNPRPGTAAFAAKIVSGDMRVVTPQTQRLYWEYQRARREVARSYGLKSLEETAWAMNAARDAYDLFEQVVIQELKKLEKCMAL